MFDLTTARDLARLDVSPWSFNAGRAEHNLGLTLVAGRCPHPFMGQTVAQLTLVVRSAEPTAIERAAAGPAANWPPSSARRSKPRFRRARSTLPAGPPPPRWHWPARRTVTPTPTSPAQATLTAGLGGRPADEQAALRKGAAVAAENRHLRRADQAARAREAEQAVAMLAAARPRIRAAVLATYAHELADRRAALRVKATQALEGLAGELLAIDATERALKIDPTAKLPPRTSPERASATPPAGFVAVGGAHPAPVRVVTPSPGRVVGGARPIEEQLLDADGSEGEQEPSAGGLPVEDVVPAAVGR